MKTWYSIQNKQDAARADVSIFDEIGMWGVSAKAFIADLKQIEAPALRLSINSPGGSVFDALAIFNALRASGKTIEVHVLGLAASAASYVAMAGDKIVMPANSFMFVHNPINGLYGNADDMREMADLLDKIGDSLTATYVKRTGKSADEIKTLLDSEAFLTAAECLALGLCDEVSDEIKARAEFDTDRLPENVRAVFDANRQAPPPIASAFADQVKAEAQAAGFGDLAAALAVDKAIVDQESLRAALGEATEIRALCALVGKPEAVAGYVQARKSLSDVRAALADQLAAAAEQNPIDTAQRASTTVNASSTHRGPEGVTTASIWAARKAQ